MATHEQERRAVIVRCMEALFAFYDAVHDYEVTTLELEQGIRLAIADGHDMLAIVLAMAQEALRRAQTPVGGDQ